jgi:Secreted and surface protein containing fasciclin-like repeats
VSGQAIEAGDIEDGQTVETVDGKTLEFSVDDGTVRVNGATVTSADAQASNGVVHVIDGVLLETVDAVDRAILTPQLSDIATTIETAGLGDSDSPLRDEDNPVTVFAPVNDAFGSLDTSELLGNSEILNRVLTHHVLSGETTASEISDGDALETLEGGTLDFAVSNGNVTVNDIPVITTNIQTETGVIHLIDGVLLERLDIVQRATVTSSLSTLATAVGEAGLASNLKGEGPFTVFAPVDSAFADYNLDALTSNQSLAQRVLTYHAIGQEIQAGDLTEGESPQTLEGGTITVGLNGDVSLNGRVTVTTTDIEVRNGVVHLLDDVLLRRTNAVQRALVTPNFSILADLVAQANLADDLSNEDGTFTVFAPTDDAFLAALDDNGNGEIDDGEVPSNAADLLKYHVANSVFYAADEPTAPSGTMIPEATPTCRPSKDRTCSCAAMAAASR